MNDQRRMQAITCILGGFWGPAGLRPRHDGLWHGQVLGRVCFRVYKQGHVLTWLRKRPRVVVFFTFAF